MEKGSGRQSSVGGPYYSFSLPKEILNDLQPGSLLDRYFQSHSLNGDETGDSTSNALSAHNVQQLELDTAGAQPTKQEKLQTSDISAASTSRGCITCNVQSFPSTAEHRSHFRSDWHRYNMKMSLLGNQKPPVDEVQFNEMLECRCC